MKNVALIFLSFCCCIFSANPLSAASILSDTIIQNYHIQDQVKATKTEALIRMRLTDFRKEKLANITVWVHNSKGQYWQGTTDEKGELFFLLPYNQRYQTNLAGQENYRKFSVPKKNKHFQTVKVVLMTAGIKEIVRNDTVFQSLSPGAMPTASRVLLKLQVMDLENRPLAHEEIAFEAKKSGKVYFVSTDKNGHSTLLLPKGETYCVHSYAYRNISCKEFEPTNHSRTSKFVFNMISTAEFKKRERERALLLARRDSIQRAERIRDSIRLARNQYTNFYLHYKYENRDFKLIETNIKKLALQDREAAKSDTQYYTTMGDEIRSMFHRNKEQWKQKRIIANIDCSMYQYIDELLVWNYSDQAEQQNNQYWLFNGFNYYGEEHSDQSRRGIFHVPQNNVKGFFTTIDRIVNFSCRGSRLENVVEALILGANGKSQNEDLLFIADNYSDVDDLHKLDELSVPVHVLLTASQYGINENYLEIAYQTKGSIHTIQEDIDWNRLKRLQDGDVLQIGKFQYRFFKGKFLKVA